MHFWGNSAHTHRTGGEPLDNRLNGLNIGERNWCAAGCPEGEKAPESHQALGLVIHGLRILPEHVKAL